jgi:hypothetical protein
MRAFDQMERDAATYGAFDVGHASTLQTLSYFDRCCRQGLQVFAINETYDWTASRPRLAAWFAKAIERPSVRWHFGKEFRGDTGPEQLKAAVGRALRLRV